MTGLQGVALAERLKDSLLSYLASAFPLSDERACRRLDAPAPAAPLLDQHGLQGSAPWSEAGLALRIGPVLTCKRGEPQV